MIVKTRNMPKNRNEVLYESALRNLRIATIIVSENYHLFSYFEGMISFLYVNIFY